MSCMVADPDDTSPKESVLVQCSGRLRHGVVAVGGETTGTTISVDRIVWEVQLNNDVEREFANEHNKESVVVTGRLRKKAGIETKVRWIINVTKLSKRDESTDRNGVRMSIQGTLRATNPRHGNAPELTIVSNGQVWPVDFSSDDRLKAMAESLVGKPVVLTGNLEQVIEDEPRTPPVIHVRTLKRSVVVPIQPPSR